MNIVIYPKDDKFLWELLLEKRINIPSPCGGNGKCGKCKVKLKKGETIPPADADGYVLACKTKLVSPCEFYLPSGEDIYIVDSGERGEYAVCDIGTTNIKIQKYSHSGKLVYSCAFENPQSSYGGDVISRISACKKIGFKVISNVLISVVASRICDVKKAYICGNPTMIHFAAGVDPSPIGVFPFEPVFKETKYFSRDNSDFPCLVALLPSASGYVGSDAVCGIYSLIEKDKTILIADLGTNGEISLKKNGEIFSATTAAGPAIEGAGIEMGLCGGDGVIFGINTDGTPKFDGARARGINGSGLVSLISYLLQTEKLSPEGKLSCKKYYVTPDVYVSQKDVSDFMLAKSAVKTALYLLLKNTHTNYSDIDIFAVTGGLARDMKIEDAISVGLLPYELKEKTVYMPDLAISGTKSALEKDEISVLEKIASEIKVISLSDDEDFEELFIMNTFFDN